MMQWWTNNEDKILRKLDVQFHPEVDAIVRDGSLGTYEDLMLTALAAKTCDVAALFDIGLRALPTNENRPSEALASYFFILSTIKGLPRELQDLATNAMVYCKNDMGTPTGSLSRLRTDYESLRSLLK